MSQTVDGKICSKCKIYLPLNSFFRQPTGKHGVTASCRSCHSLYNASRKERMSAYNKEYKRTHKERVDQLNKEYFERHKKRLYKERVAKARTCEYTKTANRIRMLTGRVIRMCITNTVNQNKYINELGCSIQELKNHFESKFRDGMSWNNYGKAGWTSDHIRPLFLFDLTDSEQFKQACHYTNLQPLWASENSRKGIKYFET